MNKLPHSRHLLRRWAAAMGACAFSLAIVRSENRAQIQPPVLAGRNVEIEWNSSGRLESAPTPHGPWTSVDSQTLRSSLSTLPVNPNNLFFRVVENGEATAAMPLVGGDPTHPFKIDRAFLRKVASTRGNAVIEADLAPGQNPPEKFPLLNEDQVLVFHDDGQEGDLRAGDGTFTAAINVNEDEFRSANEFVKAQPEAWKVTGAFAGRSLISGVLPTLFDFDGFLRGERVLVHPSPFDGRGVVPDGSKVSANSTKGRLRALSRTIETICNTNVLREPFLSFTNVLVKLDGTFVTNIDCKTIQIGITNQPLTNIVCEPQTIGFQPVRSITNVECFLVEVDPLPVVGTNRVCFTNITPNPLRFFTNIACEGVIVRAKTDFVADTQVPTTACVTNVTIVPNQPEFMTNLVCEEVVVTVPGKPTVHEICTTNIVQDANPIPIIVQVCKTNVAPTPTPQPIFSTVCATNVAFIAGHEFLTNLLVTNFALVTNIFCTNIVIGGIDTNVITLPIDDVLNRPVFWNKGLLITDLSVVEDPRRTFDPCHPERGTKMGAWTFGRLMADVCNQSASGIDPSEFTRRWLRSWQHDLSINFDTVTNRTTEIVAQVIQDWELASGGPGAPLDLGIAPFRLLAIVNRVDLRANPGYGGAGPEDACNVPCVGGEGRFVFALVPGLRRSGGGGGGYGGGGGDVIQSSCDVSQFTVIFEYCVPKRTCEEIKNYAKQWYALAGMNFGPAFNDALQLITDQFAKAGADPSRKPNLSSLNQLRANELLREPWDMREWRLFNSDSDAGWLREVTVKQTPDFDLNFSSKITEYCLANAGSILTAQHTVPLQFRREPFLGGDSPIPSKDFFWDGPQPTGTIPNQVRHMFSLNTCSGCHAGETGTPFTHVFPRPSGVEAALSDFLTGRNMPKLDPADKATKRFFADLKRREDDLLRLIKEPCFFQLFHEPTRFQD